MGWGNICQALHKSGFLPKRHLILINHQSSHPPAYMLLLLEQELLPPAAGPRGHPEQGITISWAGQGGRNSNNYARVASCSHLTPIQEAGLISRPELSYVNNSLAGMQQQALLQGKFSTGEHISSPALSSWGGSKQGRGWRLETGRFLIPII